MKSEIKKYGQVRNIPEDVEESRTVTFVASDFSKDRHGTIVNMEGWDLENFNRNPIIGWQHNVYGDAMCADPNPDQIIGKGVGYIENKELLVDITFEDAENNPVAEKVFRKVVNGFLNAVSVGFMELGISHKGDEKRGEDPKAIYFEGQELLEVSVVSIPSNKNALKKSLRSQTFDALKFIYKELGGSKNLSEIESLTVREVLDLVEGKEPEEKKHSTYELKKKMYLKKRSLKGH